MTAAIRIKVAIGLYNGENNDLGYYRGLSISAVKAIPSIYTATQLYCPSMRTRYHVVFRLMFVLYCNCRHCRLPTEIRDLGDV